MKVCTQCLVEKPLASFEPKRAVCRECMKAKDAAYRATPEGKARMKAASAAYRATPEGKAKEKAAYAAYRATPEGKAKIKAAYAAYRATPEGKAKAKAVNAARTERRRIQREYEHFMQTLEKEEAA